MVDEKTKAECNRIAEKLKADLTKDCWACGNPLDGGVTVGCPGCDIETPISEKTIEPTEEEILNPDDQILDEISRRDAQCPCRGKGYTTVVGGVTIPCPRHKADTDPLIVNLQEIYNRITSKGKK